MTVKALARATVAIFCLVITLCAIVLLNDTRPRTRIEMANVDQSLRVDSSVRPAAAEVDMSAKALRRKMHSRVRTAEYQTASNPNQANGVIRDSEVQLCQGIGSDGHGGSVHGAVWTQQTASPGVVYTGGYHGNVESGMPARFINAVDRNSGQRVFHEPRWVNAKSQAWEQFAYGEYIGPFRTPHVPDYRLRIGDQLEFVYLLTRRRTNEPYRMFVGDTIAISSALDSSLNQPSVEIMSDGTISLPLVGLVRFEGKTIQNIQRELNDRYTKYVKNPQIIVQVVSGNTPLEDLRDSVDARAGQGGQSRNATVAPDGTVALPKISSVPAIGLTLEEIGREVNARYQLYYRGGIEVTPILTQRAQRFIYVGGEVNQAGRIELTGPTSAIQAIALAQGFNAGGNIRQIIVFRRDANWQLIATRLDLGGALNGRRPYPSDEIWLRDSDIVWVPKKPIQRLSEAVNQYLTQTLYGIFPQQGVAFNFDDFESL